MGQDPSFETHTAGVLSVVAGGVNRTVPLKDLREIILLPALAAVPLAPASMLGLANWRGTVLPILDLGLLAGGEASVRSAGARVLIGHGGAGFLVDSCNGTAAASGEANAADLLPLDLVRLAADSSLPASAATQRQQARSTSVPERQDGSALRPAEAEEPILAFSIGGQEFGVALEKVEQVAAIVPHGTVAGETAAASVCWRNQDLPLASLRSRLTGAGTPAAHGCDLCMVVLHLSDGTLSAIAVDRFTGILRVRRSEQHALPPLLRRGTRAEVSSVCRLDGGSRLVCVLSPDRLFGRADDAASASASRAGAVPGAAPDTRTRYLIARVGNARLAVPLLCLDEVARTDRPLVAISGTSGIDGLCNLRGSVLPVIDLGRRFGCSDTAAAGARLLVQTIGGCRTGFRVDAVEGVHAVGADAIAPSPACLGEAGPLVQAVLTLADGAVVPVLDLERVPGAGECGSLARVLQAA
jgi:purine-binding chemotaxis protein CheW